MLPTFVLIAACSCCALLGSMLAITLWNMFPRDWLFWVASVLLVVGIAGNMSAVAWLVIHEFHRH